MRKFTNQFLVFFIGLFLLLSTGVIFYTNELVKESTLEETTAAVDKRATNMATLLNEWMLQSADSVDTAVTDFREELTFMLEDGDSIAFIDPEGLLVYSSNVNHAAEDQSNVKEIRDILEGEAIGRSGVISRDNETSEYRVAVPLYNGDGEQIGILRLSHRLDNIDVLQSELGRGVFYFSFAAILFAVFIAYYLTHRLSRPLKSIGVLVDKMAHGDYSQRYRGSDFPEIAVLGNSVNELSSSILEKNETISQTNDRMALLIQHLVTGIVLLDEEKHIQMVNPAAMELLAAKEEMTGHSYMEMFKSYGLMQIVERSFTLKKNVNEEAYLYYPQERILDVNTVLFEDQKGLHMLVLLYDITEIRRLEKVRSDFVANASHELRTPITALKGFAETLLDGAMEDPAVLREFLEIIHKEADRLEGLVNDILELSRVEQKQVPLRIQRMDITQIARDCLQLVGQNAAAKKISLQLTAARDPVWFDGDRQRVEQILMNLIQNAINYTDEGGKVHVTVKQDAGEIVLSVQDTGIGIPAEDIPRIFERFYRVDKARSRNSGGTGLGLSIVRYLVKNMGGQITVESKLGLGSTFTVRLPYLKKEGPAEAEK